MIWKKIVSILFHTAVLAKVVCKRILSKVKLKQWLGCSCPQLCLVPLDLEHLEAGEQFRLWPPKCRSSYRPVLIVLCREAAPMPFRFLTLSYWQNEITAWTLPGFVASLLALVPRAALLGMCYFILEHLNVAIMKKDYLYHFLIYDINLELSTPSGRVVVCTHVCHNQWCPVFQMEWGGNFVPLLLYWHPALVLLWKICCPAFFSTFTFLTLNVSSSSFSLIFPHGPAVPGWGRTQLWWPLPPLNGCARVQWPLSAFPDKIFWGFERAGKARIVEWEELTSQDCCSWKEVEFSVGISYFPVLSYGTDVRDH